MVINSLRLFYFTTTIKKEFKLKRTDSICGISTFCLLKVFGTMTKLDCHLSPLYHKDKFFTANSLL